MADLVVARDDVRRQEEDVRVDGRDAADVRAGAAAEGRRRRCLGALAAGTAEVPRFLEDRFERARSPTASCGEAIGVMNRERALRRDLAALMSRCSRRLTGRQLLDFKSSISGMAGDLRQYERRWPQYRHCPADRIAARSGRRPACGTVPPRRRSVGDRVRVLMTGVPMVHGAERVLEIIEDAGGLVVAMENCTGLKPMLDDVGPRPPIRCGRWRRSTSICPVR